VTSPSPGTAVPGPVADIEEISRHRGAVDAHRAGVGADAFAFIEGDHQERGHKGQGNGAPQIVQRLERRQQGLDVPLVALSNRWASGKIYRLGGRC